MYRILIIDYKTECQVHIPCIYFNIFSEKDVQEFLKMLYPIRYIKNSFVNWIDLV